MAKRNRKHKSHGHHHKKKHHNNESNSNNQPSTETNEDFITEEEDGQSLETSPAIAATDENPIFINGEASKSKSRSLPEPTSTEHTPAIIVDEPTDEWWSIDPSIRLLWFLLTGWTVRPVLHTQQASWGVTLLWASALGYAVFTSKTNPGIYWRPGRPSGQVMAVAVFTAFLYALVHYQYSHGFSATDSSSTTTTTSPVPLINWILILAWLSDIWFFLIFLNTSGTIHVWWLWSTLLLMLTLCSGWVVATISQEEDIVTMVTTAFGFIFIKSVLYYFGLPTHMNQVWTRGEWMLVVAIVALIILDHLLFFTEDGHYQQHSHQSDSDTSMVYFVARAGFISTLAMIPIANALLELEVEVPAISNSIAKPNREKNKDHVADQVEAIAHRNQHQVWTRVGFAAAAVLVSVEAHLWWACIPDGYRDDEVPKWILWLSHFLGTVEESPFVDTIRTGGEPTVKDPTTWPRFWWLGYWAVVLGVFMHYITPSKDAHLSMSSIVLQRKWFHLVALALFVPVTYFAPQMQALSYAIAISLLCLVEGLQVRQHVPLFQDFYVTFLDVSKKEETEKMVVSHICLIGACAMPLYLAMYLLNDDGSNREFCQALSWVGLIGLGVGDAAAAVAGTLYRSALGSRPLPSLLSQWGRHNRTWVGSVAMFSIMVLSIVSLEYCTVSNFDMQQTLLSWWPTLLWVTAIEAYTSQLDNLVLPLIGMTAILISHPAAIVDTSDAYL